MNLLINFCKQLHSDDLIITNVRSFVSTRWFGLILHWTERDNYLFPRAREVRGSFFVLCFTRAFISFSIWKFVAFPSRRSHLVVLGSCVFAAGSFRSRGLGEWEDETDYIFLFFQDTYIKHVQKRSFCVHFWVLDFYKNAAVCELRLCLWMLRLLVWCH